MEEEKRRAYSEVVEVLKLIDNEEKIEKIPFEVIELIKANSDPTYKPNISKEIPLEDQNLMNETYSILGWIANKYWDENISEVKENNTEPEEDINENLQNNTDNSALKEVSVYNDIEPAVLEKTELPVLVSDVGWFERIKQKVIRFFRVLFKIEMKNQKEGAKE